MIQGMLSCPTDAQIRSDLQMLGGFCATLIWDKFTWSQMVHNMVTRRPATSLEKKKEKLLHESASHFQVMRHFCWDAQKQESAVDHPVI